MISVIYPSRSRPDIVRTNIANWLHKSSKTCPEFILSLDNDDPLITEYRNDSPWFKTIYNDNKSAIEAVNSAANMASGNIFIVISDDMDCPEHWDTLLLELIGDKKDFCAKTKDGHQDWLITLPIMDRIYYERFGYIYNPIYSHLYADTELTAVAVLLDKYIELDITFPHNHWTNGMRDMDSIDVKNYKGLQIQKSLFKSRLKENFGLTQQKELPQLEKYR